MQSVTSDALILVTSYWDTLVIWIDCDPFTYIVEL